MESTERFSFGFDSTKINRRVHFGYFKSSYWSYVFDDSNFCLKITRSNYSQKFSISLDMCFVYSLCGIWDWRKTCNRIIPEGEPSISFSFNFDRPILEVYQFRGHIIISQIPTPSSKKIAASGISLAKYLPPLPQNSKPSPQLSGDFLRLLNNPDSFSDVTLKCGAEEILAHKAILSARSPVFAAMFKNQMQESSSGIVEIVDIEPNVLQATLKFVYSGETDHLTNDGGIAGDLLFAANKYQLEELKKVCVDELKSTMAVGNVFRVLALGDLHDECLKTKAKEFICKCDKFSNLEKTEGWKLLQSENPRLAIEVLLFVVNFEQKYSNKSIASK